MVKFLVIVSILFSSVQAFAMDHRSQYGVGGSLGGTFAAPWASDRFRDSVGPKFPAGGIWVRYIPGTPEIGLELSYDYFSLAKAGIRSHALIFSFISRQNPWGSFHPFYAFGMGYSKSFNWFTTGNWDAPIFKITAGIDFEMNDRTDIGFHIDHFSIFKNKATEQNLHALSPKIVVNYYFGTPAPLPPADPVPAPVPVPTPAPAAPAVAPSTEAPAPAPAKQKKTSAKPRKRPTKKSSNR